VIEEAQFLIAEPRFLTDLLDIAKKAVRRELAFSLVARRVDDLLRWPETRQLVRNAGTDESVQTFFGLNESDASSLVKLPPGEGLVHVREHRFRFRVVVVPEEERILNDDGVASVEQPNGCHDARSLCAGANL
jgi:hypothetical protein